MSRNQKIKNRYSGYALMPQSLEKDWWLILEIKHQRDGACSVYHVCQIISFDNALKKYKRLLEERAEIDDAINDAQLNLFVKQEQV